MWALQPHKNEYWLFPKLRDWPSFQARVSAICEAIKAATCSESVASEQPLLKPIHVISIDEKTSIQAIEREQQRAPLSKGGQVRTECEYIRHGTTCLMGAFNVGTGKVVHDRIHPTRTEADTAIFVDGLLAKLPPQDDIVLLADHLNTHLSESVVRVIAQKIGYSADLGEKGKTGILQNMASRKLFLEDSEHRIRFLFTPKHCSWLNPIENWFGKLERQVLTKASVKSVDELVKKLTHYIRYYNESLFKPVKWKFSGFNKDKELLNFSISKT
jgi:transposase